ncbi:MAG: cytochrome c [Candidatus Thiodiazotropha sp.]|nr:cytochrome c [Candidatus Thiodiazotropha sp.]MCM8884966.1 cytochrome c [Candidatus Thiodiazotropha sp.]MCM8922366.1 cytochrome c [Candidatus Thiodiazotropha sp.]
MKRTKLNLIFMIGLAGCDSQKSAPSEKAIPAAISQSSTAERWYGMDQVKRGGELYQETCASCHKPDASGTPNWQELDPQGNYPPPPLNGTAHTWHHPLSVLRRTVNIGGIPLGGTMPGFADKLNKQQIDDILAWVQSHWTDEIYTIWHERNLQAGKSLQLLNKG